MAHGVKVNSIEHHDLYTLIEEKHVVKQHKLFTFLRKYNLCKTKNYTPPPPIFLLPGKDHDFLLQTIMIKLYFIFDPFELERAGTQSIEMIEAIVEREVRNFQDQGNMAN